MAEVKKTMSLDFLSGSDIPDNSELLPTILEEIESASADKNREEAQARTQMEQTTEARKEVNAQTDLLAGLVTQTSQSEKEYIKADAQLRSTQGEEYQRILADSNDFVEINAESISLMEDAQTANLRKLQEINLNEQGLKVTGYDVNGKPMTEQMSTGEKILSYLTDDLFAYETREQKKQNLLTENQNLSVEIQNSQNQTVNALQTMAARVELSPEYQNNKQLAIDAETMLNLDTADLKATESIRKLAMDKYGLAQDQMNEIITIAGMQNESEKPQQLMQLLGLQMEGQRMRLAYGEQNKQEELQEALARYTTDAYEVAGFDIEDPTVKDEVEIISSALAQNRWDIVDIIGKNPRMLSVLNGMQPQSMNIDTVIAGGIGMASTVATSDDPTLRLVGEQYQKAHGQQVQVLSAAEPKSQEAEMINTLVRAKGYSPGDDEYAAARQQVISELADTRTRSMMASMRNNSIEYDRQNGLVTPAAEASVSNYYTQRQRQEPSASVTSAEVKAATTLAQMLDKNPEKFQNDFEGSITSYINNLDLTNASARDIQSYANGIANTFSALKNTNDLQSKNNPLYQITEGWTLGTDAKIGRFNFKGRDLTDAATWNFFLTARSQRPAGFEPGTLSIM